MIQIQSQPFGVEQLANILLYIVSGAAFGIVSYLGRSHETFQPRQFGKTLAVYAVAGGIVYAQGGDLSEPAVVGATSLAAPVVNQLLDWGATPRAGGSASRGRGASAASQAGVSPPPGSGGSDSGGPGP